MGQHMEFKDGVTQTVKKKTELRVHWIIILHDEGKGSLACVSKCSRFFVICSKESGMTFHSVLLAQEFHVCYEAFLCFIKKTIEYMSVCCVRVCYVSRLSCLFWCLLILLDFRRLASPTHILLLVKETRVLLCPLFNRRKWLWLHFLLIHL